MLQVSFANEIKNKKEIRDRLSAIMNDPSILAAQNELTAKKKKQSLIAFLAPTGLGIFVGMILAIQTGLNGDGFGAFMLFLFALIAGLVLGGFAVIGVKAKRKADFAAILAPYIVKTIYGDNAIYERKNGFSRQYLDGLDAFPVNDLKEEDFIKGEYNGVPCSCCDVLSTHEETHSDGKNTTTTTVTDFSGSVFSFKFNKNVDTKILVTEGFSFFRGKGIEFESIEFNKMFKTYCNDDHTAFYIITPQLEEGMININKSVAGGISFIFRGEELVVIISGRTTTFDVNPKASLNTNVNIIVDAIIPMAYINEVMKLDQKFSLTEEDIARIEAKQKAKINKGLAASGASSAKTDTKTTSNVSDSKTEEILNKVVDKLEGNEDGTDLMSSTDSSLEKQQQIEDKFDQKISELEKQADSQSSYTADDVTGKSSK